MYVCIYCKTGANEYDVHISVLVLLTAPQRLGPAGGHLHCYSTGRRVSLRCICSAELEQAVGVQNS